MESNEITQWLFSSLFAALVLVLTMLEKRRTKRLNSIEIRLDSTVTTEQLNRTIQSLRESIDKSDAQTTRSIDHLIDRIEAQTDKMVQVSQTHSQDIQGVLKQMIKG